MWKNLTFLGLVLLLSVSCLSTISAAAAKVDGPVAVSKSSGKVVDDTTDDDVDTDDIGVGSAMLGHMSKKFAEELIATPMQEAWKDIYHNMFRVNGSKFVKYIRYLTGNRQAKSLTSFLMMKIGKEVFGGHTNPAMWKRLEKELFFIVSTWWSNTPEDPELTLDNGLWHSLVLFYKDFLAQTMKGSERLGKMNAIVFDPELQVIKSWAEEWATTNAPRYLGEKSGDESQETEDVVTAESESD